MLALIPLTLILTSKMFATTLLSQQIHDTVSWVGRACAVSNLRRDGYVVRTRGVEYTRVTNRISFYTVPHTSHLHPPIKPSHVGSHFSHCHKKLCTVQHFSANTEYEIVKWVRKRWNPSLYNANRRIFWYVTRGEEESNLFARCKSDTNTIPHRRVV